MEIRSDQKGHIREFARYLTPHKWRLVVAFIAMVLVGFFGSFNFLLLKPALEVILGGEQTPGTKVTIRRLDPDGTTQTLTVTDVISVKGEESTPAPKKIAPTDVGILGSIKKGMSRLASPLTSRLKRWDERLRAYGRGDKSQKLRALWLIAGLLVAMAIGHAVSDYTAQYHLAYTLLDVVRRLRDDLFRIVLKQDYLFFIRQTTGYLESRIQSDVRQISTTIDVLLTDAVQAPLRILFLFIVLLIIDFKLTLVAVVTLPFAILPLIYFAKMLRRVTRRSKRQADQLASGMEESLRNFTVIKCFQSEDFEAEKFAKRNLKLFRYFLKRRIARFGASPMMEVLGAAGASMVLILGGNLILNHRMEFSSLMVYLVALTQFYTPLKKISRINTVLQTGKVSADRIQEMLRLRPELQERPDALPLERIRQRIAFHNVTFVYDDQPVLRDLSFEVPVGRTVAIVGQSGAGKTTLACLLLRLFDPQNGWIEIDGRRLDEYRLSDLRQRFAMVTQETILFNDTVARNIAYPEAKPDVERVERAARLANAHEFILEMDGGKGYDTGIGQSGQLLSGGQRQRIAIARAIHRNPDVLVFDEATSALDERSQAIVQEAINNLLKGRTAFIIAHRLSTVRGADEILVLDRGRLAERGTHDELMSRGGVYAALYQMIELS